MDLSGVPGCTWCVGFDPMTYKLVACQDSARLFAPLFLNTGTCRIEVSEDKAFKDAAFLPLGEIELEGDNTDPLQVLSSVKRGSFEWVVADLAGTRTALHALMEIVAPEGNVKAATKDAHEKTVGRIERILDSMATVAVRLGLVHPLLDPLSLEEMPFRRACTVVADTSGVIQGGIDFVAQFLHPMARIKVPAVVHMEVINSADSFLKRRRASKTNASALLFDHMLSQSGQRVLLRLELRPDTEIERTPLLGDPLRNAFQKDSEPEWADLNLSVPLRSYCDRLILEAARLHQAHSNPGHMVRLLTADQGLARMALAEGIAPLYFRTIGAEAFFGKRLTGAMMHPFSAEIIRTPLQAVLWELATTFGAARLVSKAGWVEVAAIGTDLTWSPLHSQNDLLWMRSSGIAPLASEPIDKRNRPTLRKNPVVTAKRVRGVATAVKVPKQKSIETQDVAGYYRFNIERMFLLLVTLAGEKHLAEADVLKIIEAATPGEYIRFLTAGDYIKVENGQWALTDRGLAFADAIARADRRQLADALLNVPSFAAFRENLSTSAVGRPADLAIPSRADSTYKGLGELTGLGASIPGEGYYPTPSLPNLPTFVEIALKRYQELDKGDGYVSVGAWLESLVRSEGVHPAFAREALEEASAAGLINRATEGSTTDTRHDQHAIRVLKSLGGKPSVETVHLYRGDFIIPGKSSSSIRLEEPKK